VTDEVRDDVDECTWRVTIGWRGVGELGRKPCEVPVGLAGYWAGIRWACRLCCATKQHIHKCVLKMSLKSSIYCLQMIAYYSSKQMQLLLIELNKLLAAYCDTSGQRINYDKSLVFF